jgi:hypothetical protein
MASGDFLELAQDAARTARFDPDDTTDLTRAKEAVNRSYLYACAKDGIQFDFLEREGQITTVAGDDTYTYAGIVSALSITGATIADVLDLVNDDDGQMLRRYASWADLEADTYSSQDGDAEGEPKSWVKWAGSRLRLYPTPDAVYSIACFLRLVPAQMTADADTPLIPITFRHEVITPGAAAILLRMEGGGEAHQEALYQKRVQDEALTAMRIAHASARPGSFKLQTSNWDREFGQTHDGDPWEWTR